MEGAILVTLSHCVCCLSWGISQAIVLTVAQTLLREVARSGVAQEASCVLLDQLRLKASRSAPVLPPQLVDLCPSLGRGLQVNQVVRRDAQVLFLCFLPFTSYILLKVNCRCGCKLRHKGSTCNFLSASFFLFKEQQL